MLFAAPVAWPDLLLFPYSAQVAGQSIQSEVPLPRPALDAVLADAARRVAASPLADPAGEPRRIYLTSGGWRWTWLALTSRGAFGLTRAGTGSIVLNASDVAGDRVINGRAVGGVRSLAGVIAHETCHGMQRRSYGLIGVATKPAWLREGYCDVVAGESSLSDADAAALKERGEPHPALLYYEGRKRVEARLRANGNDVDALFRKP